MSSPDPSSFVKLWPRCFVIVLGIIEVLAFIVLILTELGNVGANFWKTNVFAGGWCGIIILAHFIALFVSGCCAVGPPAAFRAVVVSVIAIVACATLIVFDALFLAKPSTCILTSDCESNAASTTLWSYSFRRNFFEKFHDLDAFSTYTESQTKHLFQSIQLSVGCLCFVLCIIYLVIYYVIRSKASKLIQPAPYYPQGYGRQAPPYGQPAPRPPQGRQGYRNGRKR